MAGPTQRRSGGGRSGGACRRTSGRVRPSVPTARQDGKIPARAFPLGPRLMPRPIREAFNLGHACSQVRGGGTHHRKRGRPRRQASPRGPRSRHVVEPGLNPPSPHQLHRGMVSRAECSGPHPRDIQEHAGLELFFVQPMLHEITDADNAGEPLLINHRHMANPGQGHHRQHRIRVIR